MLGRRAKQTLRGSAVSSIFVERAAWRGHKGEQLALHEALDLALGSPSVPTLSNELQPPGRV
jgi:hypothetical protein